MINTQKEYDELYAYLYRVAKPYNITHDIFDIENAIQDVIVEACTKFDGRGQLKNFAAMCMHSKCKNVIRKHLFRSQEKHLNNIVQRRESSPLVKFNLNHLDKGTKVITDSIFRAWLNNSIQYTQLSETYGVSKQRVREIIYTKLKLYKEQLINEDLIPNSNF